MNYPILLNLKARCCLVVGGGKVGTRKVLGLLAAHAQIIVISPTFDAQLVTLAEESQIEIRQAIYTTELLTELQPFLVFAATDSATVNQQIVDDAQVLNILVDSVTGIADFTSMATLQRGVITVGIGSGRVSPALVRHLKKRLADTIGEEYTLLGHWLAELRPQIKTQLPLQVERAAFWQRVLDSPILDLLREGDVVAARALLDELCP